MMCRVLMIKRSSYYAWKHRKDCKAASYRHTLETNIKEEYNGLSCHETVIPALNMALNRRPKCNDLIFHSDRGIQYACKAAVNTLESHDITQSMSRKGNCWDNAVAESFFKTLKTELIYGSKRLNKEQTRIAIFEYIELWYNKKRRHSTLNNLNIDEFWDNFYKSKFNLLNVA